MERLLLKPNEVAEALGIGRSTAYSLIAAGVIPSIRVKTALRVRVDQLNAWLESQGKPGTSETTK